MDSLTYRIITETPLQSSQLQIKIIKNKNKIKQTIKRLLIYIK